MMGLTSNRWFRFYYCLSTLGFKVRYMSLVYRHSNTNVFLMKRQYLKDFTVAAYLKCEPCKAAEPRKTDLAFPLGGLIFLHLLELDLKLIVITFALTG
jgi:hypothetical protein